MMRSLADRLYDVKQHLVIDIFDLCRTSCSSLIGLAARNHLDPILSRKGAPLTGVIEVPSKRGRIKGA
jgi:hypothetical protein